MIHVRKSDITLGCGFLFVLLGAALIREILFFFFWPAELQNPYNYPASRWLLSSGAVVWLTGIALIVLGSARARQVLIIASIGIGGGAVLALPFFMKRADSRDALSWVATAVAGAVIAAITCMVRDICTSRPRSP